MSALPTSKPKPKQAQVIMYHIMPQSRIVNAVWIGPDR